jgi:hypothetical protein
MREAEIAAITEHFFETEFAEPEAAALLGAPYERQEHEGREFVFLRPDARSLARIDLVILPAQEGAAIRGEDGELYAAEPFVEEMILVLRGPVPYSRALLEEWFGAGKIAVGPENEDNEASTQLEFDYAGAFSGQVIVRWWKDPRDPPNMGLPRGPDAIRVEEIHLRRHPPTDELAEEIEDVEDIAEVDDADDADGAGDLSSPNKLSSPPTRVLTHHTKDEIYEAVTMMGPPDDPRASSTEERAPLRFDGEAQDSNAESGFESGFEPEPLVPTAQNQVTVAPLAPSMTYSLDEAMDAGAWLADLAWRVLRVDFTLDKAWDLLGVPAGPMGMDGEAVPLEPKDRRVGTATVVPRGERVAEAVLYPPEHKPLIVSIDPMTDRFGSEPSRATGAVTFRLDGTRSRGSVVLRGRELGRGVWNVTSVDMLRN